MIKDIELTGLGNALVDILVEVREDELYDFDIKKGEMRLYDEIIQHNAISHLGARKLHKISGGSAANTIIAFSQFGGKAAYKTVLGDDEYGHFYADEFRRLNIVLHADFLSDTPTGTCIVLITPDSERSMHTCLAATAKFGKENISEDIIARSKWIYLEGYKFSEQSSTDALYHATELAAHHGTKISITFSDKFVTDLFGANLEKILNKADLVFCNEGEAMSYTGQRDAESAFKELCKIVPNVVMTRGKLGSMIRWKGDGGTIPAYPTIPLDTTGAGDMYAGAFMYGIIKTENPRKAGHLASYAASRIVSQFGARIQDNVTVFRDQIFTEID